MKVGSAGLDVRSGSHLDPGDMDSDVETAAPLTDAEDLSEFEDIDVLLSPVGDDPVDVVLKVVEEAQNFISTMNCSTDVHNAAPAPIMSDDDHQQLHSATYLKSTKTRRKSGKGCQSPKCH